MTQDQFFSRYKYDRTKDRLGGGGFGNVYKVYDTIENETLALKIAEVKPGMKSLSLLNEVELASSLERHVNIAKYTCCYRFELPNGIYDFGLLQYYPDGNLSQLIRQKKLTLTQKDEIAKGIVAGLDHLHNHNVIHRDLKSANILIAKGYQGEYVPKIADFGLSKQFEDSDKSYFSNSFAGGSLLYVAPEQLEGKELRKNVDLWSLGVVLYELFVGETPFKANIDDGSETARAEIISKIKNANIPSAISSIPVNWQKVIRGCLVTDPTRRTKSIEAMIIQVGISRNTNEVTEVNPEPPKIPSQHHEPHSNPSSSPKWLYYLIGIIAMSVVAIMGIRSCIGGEEPPVLTVYETSGLYGYKDATGTVVIPARFETASPFSAGRGKVSVADSVFYVNERGSIVELLKPKAENQSDKTKNDDNDAKDESAWKEAKRRNTKSSYERYISDYPNGKYANEVRSMIRNIEVAEQKKQEKNSNEKPYIKMISIPGRNFNLSETEVTIGQYLAFCKATNRHWPEWLEKENMYNIYTGSNDSYKIAGMSEDNKNNPITGVSYWDADMFCKWMGGRLPTEAEWEYAAKGGENYEYAGNSNLDKVGWYEKNCEAPQKVKQLKANGYGLYDMSGNVWEWTSSREGVHRVFRGGSWRGDANGCRISSRFEISMSARHNNVGFRLAISK